MATEPTAKPDVDALPVAPTRNSPTTFRARMDAFLAAMVTFRTQIVALAAWIVSTAQEVYDNAVEAATSASTATTQAGLAAADRVQTGLDRVATGEDVLSAQTAAAAAGAAAGLPSLTGNAGKALLVNPAADGVLWGIAGAMIPLAKYEVTTAVAALEFEIPSGYAQIVLVFDDFNGATDNDSLLMRTSSDSGSTWISTGTYDSAASTVRPTSNVSGNTTASGTSFTIIAVTEVPGPGASGQMTLTGLAASTETRLQWNLIGTGGGFDLASTVGGGSRTASELTDALQFRFSSGNIASGTIHVYGLVEGGA